MMPPGKAAVRQWKVASLQPRSRRRMFASFLETRRFIRDVSLVDASRRTGNDSSNQSIEIQGQDNLGSFSLFSDGVRRGNDDAGRFSSPCEALARLDVRYRHCRWSESRLLDANAASHTQLARIESLDARHRWSPLRPFFHVDHDVPDSCRGRVDIDGYLVVPHARYSARTCA